ncbi:MAG: RadC family protein [Kiritimatiellia bacterium]|jgi:DNA repair protein RadC
METSLPEPSPHLREPATDKPLKRAMDAESMPREMLLAHGRQALSDAQLLAILLRTGTVGCNVMELASKLLAYYGSLRALVSATPEELLALRLPGFSRAKAVTVCAALEIAQRVLADPGGTKKPLKNPEAIAALLLPRLLHRNQEVLLALPLDRRNHLIGQPAAITIGTVDASLAHPREIFRLCVRLSASSLIVAHNHPTGDPTPSREDIRTTRQLIDAGQVVGIPLLDHIVLGDPATHPPGYVSLRQARLADFG